jgi:hypothetical protein
MDKRRTKVFRDKLLDRREGLVGQVQAAELYSPRARCGSHAGSGGHGG